MHRGHDHHHDGGGHAVSQQAAGPGHNQPLQPRPAAQWQTLHHSHGEHGDAHDHREKDVDLVECAFVEGFLEASDPTSFLRLAQVPFEATAADGATLALLRVEIDAVVDVGSVTPHLGGGSFRYDPLPARMVSRRKRLRFVYFDGHSLRPLDLAEVRGLTQSPGR
jgi:hypothetical protein